MLTRLLFRHRAYACATRVFAVALCALMLRATGARAQGLTLPPVSLGAGVQTSYGHDKPSGGSGKDDFTLNSVRIYVNGTAADNVKFMFNTEYDGSGNHITVLDATAQFTISKQANFWVGRFLPPSDRANLYGPYYAHHWNVYTDGVQDGYPFAATGRDNGAMYWGQFGILKASVGAFDGPTATSSDKVIGAGRLQLDFWDPEDGYYLNGTYYGDKNLLAVGAAGQEQDGNKAYNADFLLEKKLEAVGSAFTVEAEYAQYDKLGGYNSRYGIDKGGYILGSYLFPPTFGMTGRFEVLGKFAKALFRDGLTALDKDYDQKTTEIDVSYIIKQFNARVMGFYLQKNFTAMQTNDKRVGIGIQVQM